MADTAAVPAGQAAKRRSRGVPERRLALFMVAPSMALIAIVALWPIIYAVWLSMHEYSLRQAGLSRWAEPFGLGNYQDALQSREFWDATRITFVFTIFSVILETIIGLAMAMAMHAAFKGQGLLRTVVLVPWAVLTVVTAIMWKTIFDPNLGFVNQILGTDKVWLGEEPEALMVMIFADVWKTAPFMALLLLAGLQVIPGEIYESAKVDGATAWQRFRKITLPLLMPALLVAVLFRTLDAYRVYDLFWAFGARELQSLSTFVYEGVRISQLQFGPGNAASVFIFVTSFLIALFFIKVLGMQTSVEE